MSNPTNNKEGIREMIAKYLTSGLRKQLLQKGDQLGMQEMRLEVCEAAVAAWGEASSANIDTLYKALTLVFPVHNYTPSKLNCGTCIAQAILKLKNERPTIQAMIAKLKNAAQPRVIQPTEPDVTVNATVEPSPANVGQLAFVVQPCGDIFGVAVGTITQRDPVMLFRCYMPINSQPSEANPELVFANPQLAIQKAVAMSEAARITPKPEPIEPTEPDPLPEAATEVESPEPTTNAPEVTPPKKGDLLDNGDVQVRVKSVSQKNQVITLEGDMPEITFEQFAKDWAIVPR